MRVRVQKAKIPPSAPGASQGNRKNIFQMADQDLVRCSDFDFDLIGAVPLGRAIEF